MFKRSDSQPSYTKDTTPRANSEFEFFNDMNGMGVSPRSYKFVDEGNGDKFQYESSPRAAFVTPKEVAERRTQVIAPEAGTPLSNLRKRKPSLLDKIEVPLPKLRQFSKPITGKTIENEDSENELEILDIELPPNQQTMLGLMVRILKHDNIMQSDIEGLSHIDLDIVRSIAKRKYGITINPKDFDDKKKLLLDLNNLDAKQKGQKRSEENNKLVFKRAIKNLISKYKVDNHNDVKNMKKKEYETLIVRYYFGGIPLPDIKKRKDVENSNSKDKSPKAATSGSKGDEKLRRFVINPNTINSKYIRFVFKSPAFKEFFDDFVTNYFAAEYKRFRPNKIRKILDAVYSNFSHKKPSQLQIQNAKGYIEKNPKFKLPWSDKELEACVASTQDFITRVFKDRSGKRKR
jgi:hypothetical protein